MFHLAAAIPYPDIDPILFQWGWIVIRWYALAYIGGLLIGWAVLARLIRAPDAPLDRTQLDDLVVWLTLGIILGGRIGYILFYNLGYYASHPLDILMVWHGGMSFHGGFLGVSAAVLLFARRYKLNPLRISDLLAYVSPIGLFLGRGANFINGELFGRVTDVPWAMVFPRGGTLPRHPSQLYEAVLEGLVLLAVIWAVGRFTRFGRKPGVLTGIFILGYGAARLLVENFRQPDIQLGFLAGGFTMGQILSIPLALFGLYLVLRPLPGDKKRG